VRQDDLCFNALLPRPVFYNCVGSSGSGTVSSFSCRGEPWPLVTAPAPMCRVVGTENLGLRLSLGSSDSWGFEGADAAVQQR